MRKILITSALPYANGPLHFGHIAGAYLPADCYSRYQRLKGENVLYICGSDEYGIAITLGAEFAGKKPKEYVDFFHKKNYEFFKQLDFSFDHFSRTTWPGHKEIVQQFFLDLCDNGYIEEKIEEHLFSEQENRFLADRYVIGICPKCKFAEARGDECPKCAASYEAIEIIEPRSKITGQKLILKPSKHWYLRFDKFKEKLEEWIKEKKWKQNVLNFAMEYIKDLKPRSITRDLDWGVPLPLEGTEGKVFYVWFDAPIGYISATKEWNEEKWKNYWLDPKTELINFIGKDNIPFHAVFFPAMLMGQSVAYILPSQIPANEFLLLEGRQFSKSEEWYIDLEDFFKKYTVEQIRYYLAANAPETSDAEFLWKEFQVKCNGDLLGKLGNFVNRILTFVKSKCNNRILSLGKLEKKDQEFLDKMLEKIKEIENCYENFHLRKATQTIMELASLGNAYFDDQKPWVLAKNINKVERLETVLRCCLECIKYLALTIFPIIPRKAQEIWKYLGYDSKLEKQNWKEICQGELPTGQQLGEFKILFRKIEDEEIDVELEKLRSHKT